MIATDRRFLFPLGDLRGQTYALGTTHIVIALPVARVGTIPIIATVADARSIAAAIEAAVSTAENVLSTGLGESTVTA
jgi:hypothetical protein